MLRIYAEIVTAIHMDKQEKRVEFMGKKKSGTARTLKKRDRLQNARQWILANNGSSKQVVKQYRKRFHVDITTAIRELQEIGVEFTQEYLEAVKRSEEERIRQKHLAKEWRAQQERDILCEYSDDVFAFIAGYTGGGAPFGITWAELGLEPHASYEELMEAYDRIDRQREDCMSEEDEEFLEDEDFF